MQSSGKIKVADLNKLLTCVLCKGYYIDATTIIECLHSFCRTCIVRYLQTNKFCPTCEVQVHKTRPLVNIRSDQTLQDIVYKLVPGLFKNEMKRRRDFYSHQNAFVQGSIPTSSEKRGDVWGCDRMIFSPEDIISVSIEYCPLNLPMPLTLHPNIYSEGLHPNNETDDKTHRRYLRCPGAITVYHLKKLLRAKYGLNQNEKVEILYMHDFLKDEYTLIDLAYIYSWKRNGPLRLFYKIYQLSDKEPLKADSEESRKTEVVSPKPKIDPSAIASIKANVTVVSPTPSIAAAHSSLSPPPSPQMAEEPNDIKLNKPNCAALQNNCSVKLYNIKVSDSKSKSVMKKTAALLNSTRNLPVMNSLDSFSEKNQLPAENLSQSSHQHKIPSKNLTSVNGFHSKKKVKFDMNIVQHIYGNARTRRKSSKYVGRHSLFNVNSINGANANGVIQLRNKMVTQKFS